VDIRKKQVADNDDASEYETVEESEDDSDWSTGCVASLFSLFGILMPKGEK
jgi:hypothetical protein